MILGLVAITSFTVVGTTALAWIRKRYYRVFYTVHVTLATILLPVLYFHVHHIRIYILETLAVYALHLLLRGFSERTVAGTVVLVPGTNDMLEIKIDVSNMTGNQKTKKKSLLSWQPGQHIYMSVRRNSFSRPLLSKNPFTISSLPSTDGNLTLVARIMDGNTATLARAAKGGTVPLTIEGPYGLITHAVELLSYNKVLFIAGGVGATFIMPLYRTLLRDLSPSAGSRRRQGVSFIWAVRDEAEANWAIPTDNAAEMEGMRDRLQLFVTRGTSAAKFVVDEETDADEADAGTQEVQIGGNVEDEDGVELDRLLPTSDIKDKETQGQAWDMQYGRPDLKAIVDETLAATSPQDRVAVFVCGPRSMTRSVRKEVKRWIATRDVWYWNEEFGL